MLTQLSTESLGALALTIYWVENHQNLVLSGFGRYNENVV